jgi:transposase
LLDRLNPTIAKLTQAIEQEVEKCPEAQRLRTHPGVGSLTAMAFVLIIGRADRFQCGKGTTPDGAGAHAHHEPAASGGAERRSSLQEEVVAGSWAGTRLQHREEAEKFYRDLAGQGKSVRVGMEASGHARWFERLLSELRFELWIGDAAEIRTKRADRELSGIGAVGGVEWESATARTYHETRQLTATLLISGSGASDGAQPPGMAE